MQLIKMSTTQKLVIRADKFYKITLMKAKRTLKFLWH